ncbi:MULTISPECIES: HD domain-containing protein [unclassified Rhodococcus (in: high G+C Gram-positive bacteria)]|uniref:HD domain-containing protein n=1 Tax=unclassified Rhodococcus (in: high G+C Gram-positive bacteria) TaxID=192944 RepID=UPI0007009394|nr:MULTISPECIES: HD domain-containing protein [unclassified Rhodococcus (in: high G+C Gram-positive bacteria)]KQU32030.1 hypothetical protein ASG69_20985 [Rhodococcus sp. Leaf225]KQU41197.1 hypothetical protein ASH03_17845 [Rhodococcus sp. Leaf258]
MTTTDAITSALRSTALKDMDPSLLAHAIHYEARGSGIDTAKIDEALAVASFAHLEQRRTARGDQTADPYITHPSRNTLRLIRYGVVDDAVLVATVLHDTVEDQPERIVRILGGTDASDAIRSHFGDDVQSLVQAVTNPPKDPTRDKAEQYAEHVTEIIQDPRVFLVKVSDFVDNAGSLKYLADETRRTKLLGKYAPLVPIFQQAAASHGDALRLTPAGTAELDKHLRSILEQTT